MNQYLDIPSVLFENKLCEFIRSDFYSCTVEYINYNAMYIRRCNGPERHSTFYVYNNNQCLLWLLLNMANLALEYRM